MKDRKEVEEWLIENSSRILLILVIILGIYILFIK